VSLALCAFGAFDSAAREIYVPTGTGLKAGWQQVLGKKVFSSARR